MTLEEYQRAVLRLGLALANDGSELPGFLLYRQLIRARFVGMARIAFRRTWALLGEAACEASFARYLAEQSPRSPILRQVIGDFAEFAERDALLWVAAPSAARDLLRFEAAKWRIASADAQLDESLVVRELDFEGVLVLNPNLVVLALQHDVSEAESDNSATRAGGSARFYAHDPHALLVYRRPGDDDVHWYRAPALLCELLDASRGAEQPLGTLVQAAFLRRGASADEALLEELASALSVAVERGVLCGVRDPRAEPSHLE